MFVVQQMIIDQLLSVGDNLKRKQTNHFTLEIPDNFTYQGTESVAHLDEIMG